MADSESIMSVTTGTEQDDIIQDMTDGEFYKLVQETLHANDVLKNETEMFEKFYLNVEPKESSSTLLTPTIVPSLPTQEVHIRGRRKVPKRRSSGSDDTMWLAPDQKCDIAMWELEEVRGELERLWLESERVLDNNKASLEEADIRVGEIKKALYEFDRDICKGAINARTNTVIAERAVRHFEDKIKSRDVLMEKLRLKNASLRVQKKKVALQLRQKEEMGEVLHEVDFNQLKIENKQYLEKIDEKNQELLRLKLMAGNTLQILNHFKKKLQDRTSESDRLYTEIDARKESLTKFEEETTVVEEERLIAEKRNKQLRRRLADYRVPHVQEYVQKKADLSELRKTVKSWERKVEIAQMALNTHKKAWHQLWTQNQQAWMQGELNNGRIN